jgi:hypothetical protein
MGFPAFPNLRDIYQNQGLLAAFQYFAQSMPQWVNSWIWPDNSFKLPSLEDTAANNNSVYYSLDAAKVVWKDGSGTVHNLS